jgi:hypothetical protein
MRRRKPAIGESRYFSDMPVVELLKCITPAPCPTVAFDLKFLSLAQQY